MTGCVSMTKPKKFQYQIQYIDNTYRIVEWTKAEFEFIGAGMAADKKVVILADGIYRLDDIRAVVLVPEAEEPEEQTDETEKKLNEWGFTDPETREWLKANGIDVGGVI